MDTNPNISRLLEMLDNPSAYSEQEILDCIHSDEETLAAYHLMAAAKQAFRLKQTQQPADVEEAWQRLMREASNNPSAEDDEMKNQASSKTSRFILHSSFKKIAAIFLAVAFLGGLAWAFAPLLHFQKTEDSQGAQVTSNPLPPGGGREGASPLSFSNLPLDSILAVVSAHYNCEVCFRDSAAMSMKFITTWNPEDSLTAFIEHLNMFDGLRLTLQDDTIFVESTNDEEGAQ
ncbi:MAG: DUF4974 domain-containing protein [Bacteroidaceae bacterium]|nr:DUF4974 domain-containing protein [Bacteroidaceae bacterium]